MFEELIKIHLDDEYAVANRDCSHPFVILKDGAMIIFDELLKISKKEYSFEEFCNNLAEKYNVEKNIITEDVSLVLEALKFDNSKDLSNMQVSFDNTYQYAYSSYNEQNKIFKAFFELTYACNLKCKHCYLGTDINSFKTKVTLDNAKCIIDELRELGVIDLTFTGGECFSHPQALEIIEYAAKKNFIISILTNGTYLDDELILKISNLPIHSVRISLYGTEKIHDDFVGVAGSFAKSIYSLTKLNTLKKGLVTATSIVTNSNIEDLVKLNSELNNLSIDHKMTCLIYPTAKGDISPTNLRINRDEMTKLMKMGLLDSRGSKCNSGISRIRISPNGDVNPCELFRETSFGNVFENSVESIINSDIRKEWIKNLRLSLDKSECNDCNKKHNCPGCIGVNYLETGKLDKKNEFLCSIAEIRTETLDVLEKSVS